MMALTDTQLRQLRAKLEAKHVKTRKANGADYVEGWHVIAEPTAFSTTTLGIGGHLPAAAYKAEKAVRNMLPLTRLGAGERKSRRHHHRARGIRVQEKARPLPRGKLMN